MNAYFAEIIAAERMADIRREIELARLIAHASPPSVAGGRARLARMVIAIASLALGTHWIIGLGA
jgi:hypothetical protein